MPEEVTFKQDETKGKTRWLACSTCVGDSKLHAVLTSISERGTAERAFDWYTSYETVQCGGCQGISFRLYKTDSNSHRFQVGPDEWESDDVEELYPPRVAGRMALPDSDLLPSEVRAIYGETLKALSNASPVLCGIGLRALLETICRDKGAIVGGLAAKIDRLTELGLLTPSNANVLHKVRTLGNNAAHEVKPNTAAQLGLALTVVEHLLANVYILDKKMAWQFPSANDPPPIF